MLFKDVIGQSSIKKRLIQEVQEGRVPHAQLFTGPEGVGKLPMAIAYARYLLCKDRREEDSCGECQSCRMFNNLSHPDLHFVFPVINFPSSIPTKLAIKAPMGSPGETRC